MKHFSCVLLSLILLFSCSENTNEPGNDNGVLIPLSVGNYWDYELVYYYTDSLGNEVNFNIDTARVEIRADVEYNHEIFYRDINGFWINRENGCYLYSEYSDSVEDVYYKYPGKKNDVYTSDKSQYEIQSVSEIKYVKAGRFGCYKYLSKYSEMYLAAENVHFISPNVGIIYEEYVIEIENSKRRTTAELINYHVEP